MNRKRQWHSKTRAGCITCKARKIKCDETRPSCQRCQNAHRVCEGYDVPPAQIFDMLKAPTPQSLNLISEDEEGIQGLCFFREQTTPVLSNFSASAADFWQYVVPRVAISEESIRYLVMAVGAQQRLNHMTGDISTELAISPAKYYRRALRRLSDPEDPPKTVIMLMCCLLFIAMENVKSTNAGIYSHINAGIRIIQEWKASKESGSSTRIAGEDLIEQYIEPFMARLEAAAMMVGAIPRSPRDVTQNLQWNRFVVPTSFPNFLAARESWYEMCQWLFKQSQMHENFFDKDLEEFNRMIGLMRRWRSVLKVYEQSTEGKRSSTENWQLRLLDSHYKIHLIYLQVQAEPGEMVWDKHLEAFRKLVSTCARFLDHEADVAKTDAKIEFAFNPGVLPVLWSTAIVCRDSELRHNCIELLQKHHNNWHDDDCSAAKMAEAVCRLEEKELKKVYKCTDMPEGQRARILAADFTMPGNILVTYSRSPYVESEVAAIEYHSKTAPVMPFMRLYPLSETVRLAGYQGLIRRETKGCICKAYAGA